MADGEECHSGIRSGGAHLAFDYGFSEYHYVLGAADMF